MNIQVMTHQCYLYPDDPRKIIPFIKRYQEIMAAHQETWHQPNESPPDESPRFFPNQRAPRVPKNHSGISTIQRGGRTSHAREVEILSVRESQKNPGREAEAEAVFLATGKKT